MYLLKAKALGIRPIEKALEPVILDDRPEAEDLDLAPDINRSREGVLGVFQRLLRRLFA